MGIFYLEMYFLVLREEVEDWFVIFRVDLYYYGEGIFCIEVVFVGEVDVVVCDVL